MGRISMPIDIGEILAIVWDHPLIAGLLILMFTPPMFPVLVFFSPLLISTGLWAVALISVGQQIEDASKREREVVGDGGDLPAAAAAAARSVIRRRRGIPGEDNWLDWVRGDMEPGSVWGQTESSMFIEDVKEEKLLADFRVDGGGIDMKEEDYHPRQQVHQFERSFSFRTGAALAARTFGGSPDRDSSLSLVPFQSNNSITSAPSQIPPMFHYSLKTGGTGASAGRNVLGNSTEAVPGGPRPSHRRQEKQQESPFGAIQQQQKTLVSFGSGFFSGDIEEPVNAVRPQPVPQQQKSLVSFGSGFFSYDVEETQKENELVPHSNRQRQQHQKELVSFGSGFFVEPEEEKRPQSRQGEPAIRGFSGKQENVVHHQKQWHHHHRQRSTAPSPDMRVSSADPAHSRPVAKSSPSSPNRNKYPHSNNWEPNQQYQRANIFEFRRDAAEKEDRVADTSRDRKPKLSSHERSKAQTYNAGLIPGNSVIYSAEPPPVDTRQLHRRDSVTDQERMGSTSRQKRNGMAARHALLMEKENTVMPFSLRRKLL
ncbi:hypothetical protein R1flu_020801 [Riccia fluitans]|uniref:Uncharacterized protein n=1 Tax=Riccia fluitans TaxID=41844 RepID=A0ABD1ZMJ6_9MARC